jgi:hypothetical protein
VNAAAEQFELGIRSRVPFAEYMALPALSISRLKEIGRSPQHYLHRLTVPKESAALRLGTAAHTAVLEPERFERQFAVWERRSEKTGNLCPRNGQYWDAFLAENPGKTIITADEHALAVAIQRAVRAHPVASRYLESGDPEVSLTWTREDGRPCRARIDWLTTIDGLPLIVGLKTSRDCRHMPFGAQAAKLGYHMQWAWYYDGFGAIKPAEPKVVEIVVESDAPHAVAVYSIPNDILLQGRDDYELLLAKLNECEATGEFPGPNEVEEPLTLPTWIYQQTDDLGDLGLE